MSRSRLHNLDFLKFLCCISILIVHSQFDLPNLPRTSVGVEFFFVLAGFFLFFSFDRGEIGVDFAAKRWIRLMPVVIASFIAVIILHKAGLIIQRTDVKDVLMTVFFVRNIGLFNDVKQLNFQYDNSHLWFIGPLFWCSLFYFTLFRSNMTRSAKYLITAFLVYWGYSAFLNFLRPLPRTFEIMRGFGGVGFGVVAGSFASAFSQYFHFREDTWQCRLLFTFVEIFFFVTLIDQLFINVIGRHEHHLKFYPIVIFFVLIILFYLQKGYLSRLLNRPWLGIFGLWSYSIYAFQYIPQIIVTRGNVIGDMSAYLEWRISHPVVGLLIVNILTPILSC